ncbi:hypothetical protein PFLUV_G00015770 [Perca fluviatilis]|uniref:Uncharacterized protein n=1 Tax=Perca fluviatilis TaxID=8168 RepID=A0A6A5FN14_PERFL|nr:hypothetical protein PFLUV_G00015770 [Perca fluviatilis]
MAELQQTPTSLCCCRKSPPASGPRCPGDPSRPAALPGPGTPRRPLVDVASASNFSCFTLRHFHLDLRLNFAVKKRIRSWNLACWLRVSVLQLPDDVSPPAGLRADLPPPRPSQADPGAALRPSR